MKLTLVLLLTVIALAHALPVPGNDDPDVEQHKKDLLARIDAQEKLTQKDIAHFDTTKLKDSPDQKDLKDSLKELAQFKADIANAHTMQQLEPVDRNLGYLEVWEPQIVARMEKQLHPPIIV